MKERLQGAGERLDAAVHDPDELAQSLDQVAAVNRFLGGTRALRLALDALLPDRRTVRILDVGCGSGDLPLAVATDLRSRRRDPCIIAADVHPQILALARQRLRQIPAITLVRLDARDLPFAADSFDVAMMSLTLHHFEGREPVRVLREMGRVARAVIINDLERRWPNYLGARLLARTLWAGNRLTRHDGPLSVRRAFTADELSALARAAGLVDVHVQRRFFYRLIMTARSASRAAQSTVA